MFPKSCTAESICELYNQTKLSKTPRIVGIWLEITVGSGKCVLDMKMVRTRETDGIFGILTSKSSIFAVITFFIKVGWVP